MATSIVKILRVVADPNRLRILLLLKAEELSVAELQEILVMGQSTISTHLSQLKQAGLVEDRRIGKNSLYRLAASPMHASGSLKGHSSAVLKGHDIRGAAEGAKEPGVLALERRSSTVPDHSFIDELLAQASTEIPEAAHDHTTARRVVKKRQDKMRAFFDSVAGRLGKDYVPGKSWKSIAEALLRLMPPMVIADLGAGDGSFSLLLAQNATKVIAVDSSAKMIEFARGQAHRHQVKNVECRLGDMEEVPIDDAVRRPCFLLAVAPPRAPSAARHRRGGAHSATRRPHCNSRFSQTSLRRSPRNVRRRVAWLQRSGTGIHAAARGVQQNSNLRIAERLNRPTSRPCSP